MSTSAVGNCPICQIPMPTSGISHKINQLFPGRHVKKLDGCDHYIHTACFQNYVNSKLATNFDHHGPVDCPLCRKTSQGVHNIQHMLKTVPSGFTIGLFVTIVSGGLIGMGIPSLIQSHKAVGAFRKISFITLTTTSLIAGIGLKAIYKSKYKKNAANMLRLQFAYYNFFYGTNLQRKDLLFGIDIHFSVEEWLGEYCNQLPSIAAFVPNDKTTDSNPVYDLLPLRFKDREVFINTMKEAIEEHPSLPQEVKDSKNHFWQIAIDESKQEKLLGFLTRLAIRKGVLDIPEGKKIHHFNYEAITYAQIHYP